MHPRLDPVSTTEHIRSTYRRYLTTIYPFRDRALRYAFREAIEHSERSQQPLLKGPLLESAAPFELGANLRDMVDEGIIDSGFQELCSEALPYERPLYSHQIETIRQVVENHRNVIVATGTGSGKTESFLLPIMDHLLRERRVGTLAQPGVRALLLYPMNALANDQLRRLRRMLKNVPEISFGRYTGETKNTLHEAQEHFLNQWPDEPQLENELLSRAQMRAQPPHLLLTNYAMLEYLLVRPEDCGLFGEPGSRNTWRFLVLDEAHIYDGATGIELALLIRRLKERVTGGRNAVLRMIATSATLGGGKQDFPQTAKFAERLFGEHFETEDVIAARRMPLGKMDTTEWDPPVDFYRLLEEALQSETVEEKGLIEGLNDQLRDLIPVRVLEEAYSSAEPHPDTFLFRILRYDRRLARLREMVSTRPQLTEEAAVKLFGDDVEAEDAVDALVRLVALASRARAHKDDDALLPARYHVFVRALEGCFVCLNVVDHDDRQPRLFLKRYEKCPDCSQLVTEIASCGRCGATYLLGHLLEGQGDSPGQLRPTAPARSDLDIDRPAYFLMGDEAHYDEDEVVATGDEDLLPDRSRGEPYVLCTRCGALLRGGSLHCGCPRGDAHREILRIPERPKKDFFDLERSEPRHCLQCGSRSNTGLIFRFLTGQDAPVSVLATALYQHLPPSQKPEERELPGEGRKLLVFSDSRQDAAFFAPYLERTYRRALHRRLLLKTLLEDPAGRDGHLRFEDVIGRLARQAEAAGIFDQTKSYDHRNKQAATWLTREWISLDTRLSLEGLGLLEFRLVKPRGWQPPPPLLTPPWDLTEDECWILVSLLIQTLRLQGVVQPPGQVDLGDPTFTPRNKALYIRAERSNRKTGIFSWSPTPGRSNRRRDLLVRLLERANTRMSDKERIEIADTTLARLWRELLSPAWRDYLQRVPVPREGSVYRLAPEMWELKPSSTPCGFQCDRCEWISAHSLRNICPRNGCRGRLRALSRESVLAEENHYLRLYTELEPVPLSAEEHTAQWTSDEAGRVQEKFVRGKINVLSCSTTFELGVDVGELQAVLMRNVPPTTANYIQRAGRAGRRTGSAAFVLTFAQRRSHDLTHFAQPEIMVAGEIAPPRIELRNEKIIRRHVQAVIVAAFFREMRDREDRLFTTVESFFDPPDGSVAGDDKFEEFSNERPAQVLESLRFIVPQDLHQEIGLETWDWLQNDSSDGLIDRLRDAAEGVRLDFEYYRQLAREAADNEQYRKADNFKRIARTLRQRQLLSFFAKHNILPKYGFPTDLVEMKTEHLGGSHEVAVFLELQRDLKIAISEYAPGAEVVAAKHIWTSGGLCKRAKKDWQPLNYAVCVRCGNYFSDKAEIRDTCTCGHPLKERNSRFGKFVIPEFGFRAKSVRKAQESRPKRIYASRVYFAKYDPPETGATNSVLEHKCDLRVVPEISNSDYIVRCYESRFGKMAKVNGGIAGRGFRVCRTCGHAEPTPVAQRGNRPSAHANPQDSRNCRGILDTYHLGHEFLTDVVEIRFEGEEVSAHIEDTYLWRSLVYALLEGATEALSIRRRDLDGTLYHDDMGKPAIILFDDVPGGAGHTRRIGEHLPGVVESAYQHINRDCCGPETSCYSCLRNYSNQAYHEQLVRGCVRDFLGDLLRASR